MTDLRWTENTKPDRPTPDSPAGKWRLLRKGIDLYTEGDEILWVATCEWDKISGNFGEVYNGANVIRRWVPTDEPVKYRDVRKGDEGETIQVNVDGTWWDSY